jgi:sialidase-1
MFSGSAVVDWNNTSGLGKEGRPPLVLIYTAAGDPTVQGIASSTDGRVFTKYPGNPVLKQITGGNRDPKVLWHEATKRWVMVLYVTLAGGKHSVHFFTSPNLIDWSLASVTEGAPGTQYLYECPDFFELPVDGNAANRKWVLTAANSAYAVGTFDGTTFRPEHSQLPGHRGRGFYAAQTFSDIPAKDGRRIQIGWFQTDTKGMPFNQSMTVPLELGLITTAEGPRLTFAPVRELGVLRSRTHGWPAQSLTAASPNPLAGLQVELLELRAEFEPGDAVEVVFQVRGATVVYEVARQELVVNGHRAPAPLRQGRQALTLLVDRTGLEVFASDGLTYVPMPYQPDARDLSLSVAVRGGTARFKNLTVHELSSAWPKVAAVATSTVNRRLVVGELGPFLGDPRFELQPLFATNRFPNVVAAMDGSVLAFWNGVKLRRSEDGGRTWGEEIQVGPGFMGGGVIVDEHSGDVLAFVEAAHPPAEVSIYRSSDHGRTWRKQETTIRPDVRGNVPSMHMNEHGITLRQGRHAGRLIRPTRSYAGGNDKARWPEHYTNAMFSDDGGRTWLTSDPFPAFGTGEATLAELADGRIYYNSRRHWAPAGEDPRRRWTAWSEDGGQTWTNLAICRVLPDGDQDRDYGLMGGLVRLPVRGRDILIYSNIESPSGRHHGHVWASLDGGKTWPVKRLVHDGAFAYSSLDAGRPGTAGEGWIYLLFEGGPKGGGTLARFNLSWVLQGEKTGDGVLPSR